MKRFLLCLTIMFFAIIGMAQTSEIMYSSTDTVTVSVCSEIENQYLLVLPGSGEEKLPDNIVYSGTTSDFSISYDTTTHIMSIFAFSEGTYTCTFERDSADAGVLNVKVTEFGTVEFKEEIETMVSTPTDLDFYVSKSNMILELTMKGNVLSEVTVPAEEMPKSATIIRYSVTVDEPGKDTLVLTYWDSTKTCSNVDSLVLIVRKKLEAPILKQDTINICRNESSETDSLSLSSYVQSSTVDGVSLKWYDSEGEISSNFSTYYGAGSQTFYCQYEAKDNELLVSSDSSKLLINIISPDELGTVIYAPETITLPETATVSLSTLTWANFSYEWKCDGATFTDEKIESDTIVEAKTVSFENAGTYTLYVTTSVDPGVDGTQCVKQDSVTIVVNPQPQMSAPIAENQTICKSSIAATDSIYVRRYVTDTNSATTASQYNWYDTLGVKINEPILLSTSAAGEYNYYVSCASADSSVLESEKVKLTITLEDIETPVVENANQVVCGASEIQAFKANTENAIWIQNPEEFTISALDNSKLATGAEFTPTDTTSRTYGVLAMTESGCYSSVTTVSLIVEHVYVGLEISDESVILPSTDTTFVEAYGSLDEATTTEPSFTYTWSCDGATLTKSSEEGESASYERMLVSFAKAGDYAIVCTATTENGCSATDTAFISSMKFTVDSLAAICPSEESSTITILSETAISKDLLSVKDAGGADVIFTIDESGTEATFIDSVGTYNVWYNDKLVQTVKVQEDDLYAEISVEPEDIILPNTAICSIQLSESVASYTITCAGAEVTDYESVGLSETPDGEASSSEGLVEKQIMFTEAGEYTLICNITSKYGCKDSSEYTFKVSPQPQMSAPIVENQTICKSSNAATDSIYVRKYVTDTNSATTASQYNWYDTLGVKIDEPILLSTSAAGEYNYYVSCASADSSVLESEKVKLTITLEDIETPVVENANQVVCGASEIQAFKANTENAIWIQNPEEFTISVLDNSKLATGAEFTPTDTTSNTYGVLTTTESGCYSDVVKVSLTVEHVYVGLEISDESVILPSTDTTFVEAYGSLDEATTTEPSFTYTWSCDGATLTKSSEEGESASYERMLVSFAKAGDYAIVCTAKTENGCSATDTAFISAISYTVPNDTVNLTLGDSYDLVLYANGAEVESDDIQWSMGIGSTSFPINLSDATVSAEEMGNTTVFAYVNNTLVAQVFFNITAKYELNCPTENVNLSTGSYVLSLSNLTGDEAVTWVLGDTTVASLTIADTTCTVDFKKSGTCTIECLVKGDVSQNSSCSFEIVNDMTLATEELTVKTNDGESSQIVVNDSNGNVIDPTLLTYTIMDTTNEIISVSDSGLVIGIQEGTSIVSVSFRDESLGSVTVNSQTDDYSLSFDAESYTLDMGSQASACYMVGASFESSSEPTFAYDSTIISVTFDATTSCPTLTGLKPGNTTLEISIGDYSASADVIVELGYMIVNRAMNLKVSESEQISVIDAEKNTIDSTSLTYEILDSLDVVSVDKNGNVVAEKQGNATISVKFGEYEVGMVSIYVETQPQMAKPSYNTNEITICYSKDDESEDSIVLSDYVYTTEGLLQWYDNAGNVLDETPVVSTSAVGTTTYYVSQKGIGDYENYLESEKVKFSVTILYVPKPTLNMYDQKICDGSEVQPFVATTQEGNIIQWLLDTEIQEESSFVPTSTGSFDVRAYNKESDCLSEVVTVTNTIGNPIVPEIIFEGKTQTVAPNEPINLSAVISDTNAYDILWKNGDDVIQGQNATFSFSSVGSYTIECQSVEKETGCIAEVESTITVEQKTVLVESISVEPEKIVVSSGDKTNYSVSVYPSYATNKRYTVSVDDVDIAVVRGKIIYGLQPGVTFMTVTSKDKNASVVVPITVTEEYVAAQEISLPNIYTMAVGDIVTLDATIKPENATNKNVEFRVVGDSVITVADGILTAIGEGTATLVAQVDNVIATSVVYVTSNEDVITDITVPETVVLKKGESKAITCKVTPVTLATNDLNWSIEDDSIASVVNNVVTAVAVGTTNLTISSRNITKSVAIVVNNSDAPQIEFPETFYMPNAQEKTMKSLTSGYTEIPVSQYVSDDNTSLANMTISVTTDQAAVTASIDENGKILVNAGDFIGTVKITVTVVDVDGLTSTGSFFLVVEDVKNQAPTIVADTIQIKYNEDVFIGFADLAKDDYTPVEDLTFEFATSSVEYEVVGQQLRLKSVDENLEMDTLKITVTDIYGDETTGNIVLLVNSLPNKAPVIAEIPEQIENDSIFFSSLDLRQYVKDDYTSPSAIVWSAESSTNIAITITDGVAVPTVLNKFWNGAEAITFVAKDEDGLTSSVVVYYTRKISQESYDSQVDSKDDIFASKWDGAPTVTISTMRQIGVPGDVFVLMANISSFDCTWEWNIKGAQGIDQTSMLQMVTFEKPGVYPVSLTVTSADEKYTIVADLAINLTVVGIQERDIFICQGQSAQLNATDGVTSYYWSTGEVAQSISVRPEKTTSYKVTMKKGMFTMTDSVVVNVSVPVALMEDSVMCAGTTFELEAQGEYNSYSWNNGENTKSIMIPSEIATYSVFAVDSMKCVSVDTFNITKVNSLPEINLGEDQTYCDGTTVTLDAGEGYTYLWSTGATTQTIDLIDSTRIIWAQITDDNLCVNVDTIAVAFSYPYPEQLGVATFSETSDNVILAWEKTADVNTVSYRIERETDVTDNWEQVGEDVAFNEAGIVVDENVNSKQRAYKYRLVTVDGCGNEAISESHRTMHSIKVADPETGLMQLQWTAYEPMSAVTQYLVLRGTDVTAMDTVDQVPASNLYETWSETDASMKDMKYRVVFRLKDEVNENAYITLDNQTVKGAFTKAESGPFSLAMSNIAEVENGTTVKEIAFPADVVVYPTTFTSVINVAIASHDDANYMIEVLNENGQVVAKTRAEVASNAIVSIPAEGFAVGLYNVRISAKGQVKTIKVVK